MKSFCYALLIIETPKREYILIEIKSKDRVTEDDVRSLKAIAPDVKGKTTSLLVSNQKQSTLIGDVKCLNWQKALEFLFG
jgi:hypothetical protein